MTKKDFREAPHYLETMKGYIEKGLSRREVIAAVKRDFAKYSVPPDTAIASIFNADSLWRSFKDAYSEDVERLWALNEARARSSGGRVGQRTLEEVLAQPPPSQKIRRGPRR